MYKHVGFLRRFIAFMIDIYIIALFSFVILLIVGFITISIIGKIDNFEKVFGKIGFALIIQLIGFITTFLYFYISNGKYSRSIGKKILKIKIVTIEYKVINFKIAALRSFVLLFSCFLFGIGCLLIFIDEKNRSLHDKIAKTFVIYSD